MCAIYCSLTLEPQRLQIFRKSKQVNPWSIFVLNSVPDNRKYLRFLWNICCREGRKFFISKYWNFRYDVGFDPSMWIMAAFLLLLSTNGEKLCFNPWIWQPICIAIMCINSRVILYVWSLFTYQVILCMPEILLMVNIITLYKNKMAFP